MLCPNCGFNVYDKTTPMRIRAHVMTESEYHQAPKEFSTLLRALYRDQQVYTHIDVYSPLSFGESLLYRVKL